MRDPTVDAAKEEAIEQAIKMVRGFVCLFKPSMLDPVAAAQRDEARRWLIAVIPTLPAQLAPPPGMTEFILQRLTGQDPLPRKRGRHSGYEYRNRDAFIVGVIKVIAKSRGINPTRNREQRKVESACSILHKALRRLGVKNLDERAIESIWEKQFAWPERRPV
jgi:hypothetical protein